MIFDNYIAIRRSMIDQHHLSKGSTMTTITINIPSIEEISAAMGDVEITTPYANCKIVNSTFAALKINKVLPSQMFYNKTYKNKFVSRDAIIEWMFNYIKKNALSS